MINSRVIVFLFSIFFNQVVLADEIKWYAQDFKPYAYEKNEVPTGLAVDIAVAMMKQMNISASAEDINVRVLSKFFVKMNDEANNVFFPIVENEKRKDYFKFVGPIAPAKPVIVAPKAKSITINSPNDLNSYKIATIDGYFAMQDLINENVNSNIFYTNSNDRDNVQAMINGDADMVLCDELSCLAILTELKIKKDYQVVYQMPEKNFSFAFANDTSDDVIKQAQMALDSLKNKQGNKESKYQQIMQKYELNW